MLFVKRHKVLTAIFAISIFLMIKNSSIPYFFTPPGFVSFIFDKPQSEFFCGVAQMVDIFASAYVTSLLFYYMVEYLPTIREEKNAKEIIAPKLVSLYLYISELLAMIEYSLKRENLFHSENPGDMDKLSFQNGDVYCKRKSFKNEDETGLAPHSYNLLKDSDKYRTLILCVCNQISGIPSFSYCDPQVIHIISEIQLSELLRMLPKPDDSLIQFNPQHMGLGVGYQQLSLTKEKLKAFVNPSLDCCMTDISNEEINKWREEQAEAIIKNPEIINILAAMQSQSE